MLLTHCVLLMPYGIDIVIIGSDNVLSLDWCQAITWTNVDLLSFWPIRVHEKNLNQNIIFSFKQIHLKMLCAKCQPFWPDFSELVKKTKLIEIMRKFSIQFLHDWKISEPNHHTLSDMSSCVQILKSVEIQNGVLKCVHCLEVCLMACQKCRWKDCQITKHLKSAQCIWHHSCEKIWDLVLNAFWIINMGTILA